MKNLQFLLLLFCLLFFGLTPSKTLAQTNEDCLMCHADQGIEVALAKSPHKKASCISCHKDAAVAEFPHADDLKKVNCGSCHKDKQAQVQNDIHSKLKKIPVAKKPTCQVCHGSGHSVIPTSTLSNKSKQICGKCHSDNKLISKYHVTDSDTELKCSNCHIKQPYKTLLSKSVHSGLSCSNCHSYAANNPKEHRLKKGERVAADCYVCHPNIAAEHKESIHGLSILEGMKEAAHCWDCHGSHSITAISSSQSKVSSKKIEHTCGKCHDNPAFNDKHVSTVKQPGKKYATSVHGKLVAAGSKTAPTCATCHGVHNIKNRVQENSMISATGITDVCIKCHKQITEEYTKSIHWLAVKKGIRNAPTCNDCHSEHEIFAINTNSRRQEIKRMQEYTCLTCHNNLLLAYRYNINQRNVNSYQDSYHGLAVMHGDDKAAMCIDCHGMHKILPKYHHESSVNPDNIVSTCKKCHTKATAEFAKSYSHDTDPNTFSFKLENIIRTVYFWIIIIIVGIMLIHNLIIFIHDIRLKYKTEVSKIRISRFTKNELYQHTLLMATFMILAITGFQLKYPNSWWAEGLTYIGLTEDIRRYVHRASAILMIILSVYHVIYLLFTRRGRAVLYSILPRYSDVTSGIQTILYYLRLKKEYPEFDQYDYTEKVEYWALIWGTIIMGLTGIVLWFPALFTTFLPSWSIKVSEIIHFYEAILASLAILIWHWFFVIMRVNDFPISHTTLDGKMSVAHYKSEHKLRYKKIVAEYFLIKNGKKDKKKISIFTEQFISEIEKRGLDIDEFMQNEINSNDNLKEYVDKQLSL